MSDRMTDVRLREIENMSSYDKHVRSSSLHKEMLAEIYALRNAVKVETARADGLQGQYDQCCKNYKELVELWKAETARADAAEKDNEILAESNREMMAKIECVLKIANYPPVDKAILEALGQKT